MGDQEYELDYDASFGEEWRVYAAHVLPYVPVGSPVYELMRIAYYSGLLTMLGKAVAMSESAAEYGPDAVRDVVAQWGAEAADFAEVATDENVNQMVALCIMDPRSGGVH